MPASIHPREIPGIAPEAVHLLEAAGHDNALAFARMDPVALHSELRQANASLRLTAQDVSLEEVERWQQEIDSLEPADADESMAVDYEQSEEVQAMLKASPFALPLPVDMLKENRVAVSQIPKGILLNHYVGDLDVRVNHSAPKSRSAGLDAFRKVPGVGRSDNEWSTNKDQIHVVTTPLPATNRGKNPNSRWFIRGVLHAHPFQLYVGAIATFLIVWLVPASVVSAVLLILSMEMPEQFAWVSPQLLWVPAGLLSVGLVYLTLGLGSSCRVCNQKLFIYRSHIKSSQAHHFPGLGYVLPLCLHLMVFRWFRCTHCGTPIRLKK